MTDTPSSILLLRLQSVGSNVNLWGGYLNTALQTLERASKGYEAATVLSDATISWSNYSSTNDASVAFLKLIGSLSSAATLTFPSVQHYLSVRNATGAAVTIKCSGGTGVTIANGAYALLYCDGVDYYNAAPTMLPGPTTVAGGLTLAGQIDGLVAATAPLQGVNLQQMQAAIAASVPLGTAGTFLNSGSDQVRGYTSTKVTASGLLKATTVNPGGNESLNISTASYTATGTNTYVVALSPAITAYPTGLKISVIFTNSNTGASTLDAGGGPKAITKNGAVALTFGDLPKGSERILTYDGTQFQVDSTPADSVSSDALFMSQNFGAWGS